MLFATKIGSVDTSKASPYNDPKNSDRQSGKNKLECNHDERTKNIYPRAKGEYCPRSLA
jgi:hypothetical protein